MASQLKHTVAPSGGDFTSLDAAIDHLVAAHADLVTADVYADVEISGEWSSADTTVVAINGITTDATRYLNIYTTGDARHAGVYSTSKYRITATDASIFTNDAYYCRISGIQFGLSATGSTRYALLFGPSGAIPSGNDMRMSDCIVKMVSVSGETTIVRGISITDNSTILKVWNCVIDGFVNGSTSSYGFRVLQGNTVDIFNCTINGCYVGIYRSSSTTTVINCLFNNCTSDASGTITDSYCATTNDNTKGLTALGTGNRFSQTFTFVAAGNYHLASNDAGALDYGDGSTVKSVFTTDIDGENRPASDGDWDIGADEYVAEEPAGEYRPIYHNHYQQMRTV